MAGLVPAIHVFLLRDCKDVDARHEAGHDGVDVKRPICLSPRGGVWRRSQEKVS